MTESVSRDHLVTSMEALERLYGEPFGPSLVKETDRITAALPRLHRGGAVLRAGVGRARRVRLLAARRRAGLRAGRRREDAARSRTGAATTASTRCATSSHDPRVALLFLIPGCGETIRVNGRATISTDPALTQSFVVDGKAPRTVIVVAVERIYYQCAKAIVRSKLWDASRHVERKSLPSAGTILADLTDGKMGGAGARPHRARAAEGDAVLIAAGHARDPSIAEHFALPSARAQAARACAAAPARSPDRRAVLVERHHDLARVQVQAGPAAARRVAVDRCRRRSASPSRRNARAADGCGR